MSKIPQKFEGKVNTMKNIIMTTSRLLSEYGNSVSIEVGDFYNVGDEVNEIVLEIKITDVDCPECDFEPSVISDTINEIIGKIYKGCKFGLTGDLQFKNGFTSTRGVLLYETKLWRDNFEYLLFGVFIDPGKKY